MPSKLLSSRLHTLSHLFLFMNLAIALIGIRLPDILNMTILRFVLYFLFLCGFMFGLFSCFILQRKLTLGILLFVTAIFIHACIIYFLPSFHSGVAFQNYALQEENTSYYILAQTRLYSMYPILFVFPIISLYFEGFKSVNKELYARILIYIFLISIFINNIVIFLQGIKDLTILSQGSGSSVGANRAAGLLQDSGESSVIYSLVVSLFLLFNFKEKFNIKNKIAFFILVAMSACAGIFIHSRLYYIILIYSILLFIMTILIKKLVENKFFQLPLFQQIYLNKNFKKCFLPFFLLSVLGVLFIFKKLLHKYEHFDLNRASHLKVMLKATKDHFFTGTGVGSFQENLLYYYHFFIPKEKLQIDLPTNLYFCLTSELGIVGLALIIVCLSLLFKKIFLFYKSHNNIDIKNHKVAFLKYCLPSILSIPILICFLVGYNFVFASISIITIFLIVSDEEYFIKLTNIFTYSASCYLLCVCAYFLFHIPRVPAFRWAENGHAQIPISPGSLPQPGGKKENKIYFAELVQQFFPNPPLPRGDEFSQGKWLKLNNELLLLKSSFRIYIPTTQKVTISYYGVQAKKVWEETKFVEKKGWVDFVTPSSMGECLSNIGPTHFCSYKIRVKNNFFSTQLFFIESKNLP